MSKIKHRLQPVRKLLKKLETVCHLYVKLRGKRRNNGRCERCGVNPIYSANHILPAGDYPGVRYDEENIFAGCPACNIKERFHRLPEAGYWRARLGTEKYEALCEKGRQIKKWSRDEVVKEIERFRELLEIPPPIE